MSQELAYVIITPHSLRKSRTGGILSRLITRTGLDLVGARMFGPSRELIEQYADTIVSANDPQDRQIQESIRDYILHNLSPDPTTQRRRRAMVLLFQGEDAVRRVRSVVGNITHESQAGETIRDTFGDYVTDHDGNVRYFEPAVLAAPTREEAEAKLKLWNRFSDSDGGLLENTIAYPKDVRPQRTLVLIKPDNFRFPTGRPGNVIDFFSRTGLSIVGIKIHRMSVAEAMDFYGPVREVLRTKLTDMVSAKAKGALEKEFGFPIPEQPSREIGNILGPIFGDNQFDNIIRFMSGRSPGEAPDDEARSAAGSEKCIALIYEGPDAIQKIRDVLGPTDPSKAPPGSIRREFGQTIMVNAAHASDSEASVEREMKIVRVGENRFRQVIEAFFQNRS